MSGTVRLRNALAIAAAGAVAVAVVWELSGVATWGPNGGGTRADLPVGAWILFTVCGAVAAGMVFAVLRRR